MTRIRLRSGPALRRVLDLSARQFLVPYLGRERSISQAASELGVSLSRMGYQTARLKETGLVVETRTQSRAGRPVRFYRSTADEYLIALEDLGQKSIEQYLLDAEQPLRRAVARSLVLD